MIRKAIFAAAILGVGAVYTLHRAPAAELVVLAPKPVVDMPLAAASGTETAILSGGCFWGMQDVFQHVKGVKDAVDGYTGGSAATADYPDVSTGTTGQAESLRITFDPSVISYGTLLRIFVSVAADPTQLNYQGPDSGTQYRSEIWVENAEQRKIAMSYIAQLTAAHTFPAPIVVRVDNARPFYLAETYHQNFATLNPDNPYIATIDAPKVTALATLFPTLFRKDPTRVDVYSAAYRSGT
jgi:peptide-methionine (S)-S-oxide reductase